jgi:GT2 family glycosyltransferase
MGRAVRRPHPGSQNTERIERIRYMTTLAVLITAYNREDFVENCIKSVQGAASSDLDIQIYVMNNGSTDNTESEIRKCGDEIKIFSTPENRNVIEVINRGLKEIFEGPETDYLLLLNEDTKFEAGALETLIEIHKKHPVSFMTPLQLNYREPDRVDANALKLAQQNGSLVEDVLMKRPLKDVYELPLLIGASLFGRTEDWINVGYFDRLFWFYGCDNDFCERALHLGYHLYLAPQSILFHAHGKLTPTESVPDKKYQYWRWRTETQSRYMMRIKRPGKSLMNNYGAASGMAIADVAKSITALWPRGIYNAISVFASCVFAAPKVFSTRKKQLDPAKKVQAN